MLAVCTDGEEVDFVTPEFAQALDNRARSEFGLEIPSCFQGNPFTRAQPVMHHLTTGRTQGSVDDHFKAFALVLEEPCVHHPPATHQADAVVLQKIAWSCRNSVPLKVGR